MRIFNFFRLRKKSNSIAGSTAKSGISKNLSFLDVLLKFGITNLAAHQAILYYQRCAPVATAIDLINKNVASVSPIVYNPNTDEYIDNHPVLDLLQNPNADSTYQEFIKRVSMFLNLTGTAYINCDKNKSNSKPVAINVIPTSAVTPIPGSDGYPEAFTVSFYSSSKTYKRYMKNSRFRFYSDDGKELYQIKTVNPDLTNYSLIGLSPLQPISMDIEQLIAAATHNLSLLKRGASLGGIVTTEQELSDEQFQRFKSQFNEQYVGEDNSGRIMLGEMIKDFKQWQQNNKDMDFLELKKNVTESIYNRLSIPLPLVSSDTMTMANLDAAKLDLYDNCIKHQVTSLFQELTLFLMDKYKGSEDYLITYDESKIDALMPRRIETLKQQKDIGINTPNELRKVLWYNNLDEGGDSLYLPSNLVPIAEIQPEEDGDEEYQLDKDEDA